MERVFLEPANSTHRQYEALRAYFVDGLPSAETAARFGYSAGSFRVLCHQLRQNPQRRFFLPPQTEPPKRRTSGRKSLRFASRTSPYTTSTKRLPANGRGSARLPSPLCSKRKVSPGCRAGPMRSAPGDLALRRPRSQICDSWISRHGASALSSVACFSFSPLWCRLVLTRSSTAPAYLARQ